MPPSVVSLPINARGSSVHEKGGNAEGLVHHGHPSRVQRRGVLSRIRQRSPVQKPLPRIRRAESKRVETRLRLAVHHVSVFARRPAASGAELAGPLFLWPAAGRRTG